MYNVAPPYSASICGVSSVIVVYVTRYVRTLHAGRIRNGLWNLKDPQAYHQLGLRGVFRDPAGPQHGEGGRTTDGREGGYRGPRHPKILSMMTAGARDENAPGAVGAERSRRACPKNSVLRLLQNLLQGS